MFKHIIAIDIAQRIGDFLPRIQAHGQKITTVQSSDELLNNASALHDAEAVLISIYQPLSIALLQAMHSLRHIFILGTSTKKIPLDYCAEHSISVVNIIEYCDHETAEWVMMHLLKHFRECEQPRSLVEKKLCVIGVGAVGKLVIKLARAFAMEVFYNSEHAHEALDQQGIKYLTKEAAFSSCDVISVHTPPNISWLSRDLLRKASPNLLLINTCMGRICVADDLEDTLRTRSDITLIMDSIASAHYPDLKNRARISNQPAFSTLDSQARLVDKFFANIKRVI